MTKQEKAKRRKIVKDFTEKFPIPIGYQKHYAQWFFGLRKDEPKARDYIGK